MPLESIQKDSSYAHLVSGKIYTVVAIENGRVKYQRDDDGREFQLSEDSFKVKFRELTEEEKAEREEGVGILVTPSENDVLERLILPETVTSSALDGLRLVEIREDLDRVWGLSTIMPLKGRCVMNFWGPPGTGKTALTRVLAKLHGKCIYQVDYSAVISKWVGDTAKHIKAAFAEAKEHGAILMFDEADSLLSKRITDMSESFATSINQNRNVLMQELDRHDGIVICNTNLVQNYDEAILRRIIKHVEFSLPDAAARTKIFKLHFPKMDSVSVSDAEWDQAGRISETLSGGDILTTAVNTMLAGSKAKRPTSWKVTFSLLSTEINNTLRLKAAHGNKRAAEQLKANAIMEVEVDEVAP